MAKKEMKYYLRKSAFGLASVSAALLVGTASVSAQVTTRGQIKTEKEKADKELAELAARISNTTVLDGVRATIADTRDKDVVKESIEKAKQIVEAQAEAEAAAKAEEEHAQAWENAAKEELAKQNSQVVYMFGSKQGITLPQELLDVIGTPESITVKKGQTVPLPGYNNVRTATGVWKFAGWSNILASEEEVEIGTDFVAPGDGDIMLIGYWEFVPFNANVLVSYVDTEGNVLGETVAVSQGLPGEAYDTTSLRLDKIEKDGKVYKFKKLQEGSPSETGTTLEGDLRVVYVYEEVKPEPKP
ncbi:TPA: MucBP domain-containing protein, partial [Streptococcus equi subsp. zooepidemicus]|nr:MucBP domain-containing protein [Streptococcus equi subsp. zooepidemicus]HEL0189586.1 MucBP domain-containing protein [Streptococcus equi subsp. zooepidemicus]HEL0215535.1 MucBP domain-containing protein [Streptococcus equi subsp. zooepidemicus]HEL0253372.1 MucBP domain-containing protein [Streptococcus equi subsp. zooepidemicus]HEL0329025.1 MucBP domain-containing protein [Streptococcus equi subsp. zooepidemicus]